MTCEDHIHQCITCAIRGMFRHQLHGMDRNLNEEWHKLVDTTMEKIERGIL